jgi:hypothetical protein
MWTDWPSIMIVIGILGVLFFLRSVNKDEN